MVAKNIERILTEAEALETKLGKATGAVEDNHVLVVRACTTQLRALAEKANRFAMEMTLRTMRYQHAQLWEMQQQELDSSGTAVEMEWSWGEGDISQGAQKRMG